jgi:hypothetical protein
MTPGNTSEHIVVKSFAAFTQGSPCPNENDASTAVQCTAFEFIFIFFEFVTNSIYTLAQHQTKSSKKTGNNGRIRP